MSLDSKFSFGFMNGSYFTHVVFAQFVKKYLMFFVVGNFH